MASTYPNQGGGSPGVDCQTLHVARGARRFRGEESGYAPWLALLPHAFTTPLFYTPDELDQLRGTTLHQATL